MSAGFQYVVEATTPDGDVEFSGDYTATSCFGAVVKDMVQDYANETGLTPSDVKVTDAWRVQEIAADFACDAYGTRVLPIGGGQ